MKYKIIRFYRDTNATETIKRGLTLKEAQKHCRREDTHKKDENGEVIWFDGYDNE